MSGKRRYSYTDVKQRRKKVLLVVKILLILFVSYALLTGIFLHTVSIASSSMKPTLSGGDFLLVSPIAYGPVSIFADLKMPSFSKPKRGDIVLIDPPYLERYGFFPALLDASVRFLSFQRLRLFGKGKKDWERSQIVKRVIGIPGDSVYMSNFIYYIKIKDSQHFLTEFEVARKPYDTFFETLPEGWNNDLPFSGSFPQVELKEGEYLVSGDNRSSSNDSRSWGVLSIDRIRAKVLLKYWPIGELGVP